MDIQEHLKPWLDRKGLVALGELPAREAMRAIVKTVPTFVDARRLTACFLEAMGERVQVEEELGPQTAVWLREVADPEFVHIPAIYHEQGFGPLGDIAPLPKARIVPKGPDMHAGKLTFSDGMASFAVGYDAEGMSNEVNCSGGDAILRGWQSDQTPFTHDPAARPPTAAIFTPLLRKGLDPNGHPIGTLAGWLAEFDFSASDLPRVRTRGTLPYGPMGCVQRSTGSAAVLAWTGKITAGHRWLAVDGWCGRAWASSESRTDAIEKLETELWRVKPPRPDHPDFRSLEFDLAAEFPDVPTAKPEVAAPIQLPVPPPEDEEGKTTIAWSMPPTSFSFSFVSQHEWPPAGLEHVPVVLYSIPPYPEVPEPLLRAGFAPVALVSREGRIVWAFRRTTGQEILVVGAGVADLVDPESILDELDDADDRYQESMGDMQDLWAEPSPWVCSYALWDNLKQARGPADFRGYASNGFHPSSLDADQVRWQVVRVQRRRR